MKEMLKCKTTIKMHKHKNLLWLNSLLWLSVKAGCVARSAWTQMWDSAK